MIYEKYFKNIMLLMLVLLFVPMSFAAQTSTMSVTDSSLLSVDIVNIDPDPAESGDIVEVRISVENKGGESANDVSIEFVEEYPFTLVSGESQKKDIGSLMSYQDGDNAKIVKFKIQVDSEALPGDYDFKLNVYKDRSLQFQKTLSVDVENPTSALSISMDKTSLAPGEDSKVTFTIENKGGSTLQDLVFSWTNDDKVILPLGTDNTKYIKELGVGESSIFSFNVIADSNADSGLYELLFDVEYQNSVSSSTQNEQTSAGFYVGGGTDFDLSFSDYTDNEMSFNIANIGNNPAYSVNVNVKSDNGWQITGASSEMIGNLNNGDYTVVSFNIAQSGKSSSSSDVILVIDYTDTKGQRLSVEKEVDTNLQTNAIAGSGEMSSDMQEKMAERQAGKMGPMGNGNITQYISIAKNVGIGIVVVLLLFFGYKIWQNRARKKIKK